MRFGSSVHFLNKPLGGEVALRDKRGWNVCEDGGGGLSSCLRQTRLDISDKNRRCVGILLGIPMDSTKKHRKIKCRVECL